MSIKEELGTGHKAIDLTTRAKKLRTEAIKTLEQLKQETTNAAKLAQEAQKSTDLEWRFFVIDDDYEQKNTTTKIHGYVFIKPANSTEENNLAKAPGAHLALIQHKAGGPQVIRRAMATRASDNPQQGVGYYEFTDLPITPGEYSIRGKYVDNKATVYEGEIDPQRGGYTNFRRENQTHLVIDENHAEPQEAHLVLKEVPPQKRIGDGGKAQQKQLRSKNPAHPGDKPGGETQDEDATSEEPTGKTSSKTTTDTDRKTTQAQKPTVHIRPAEGALKPVEQYALQGATAKVTDHLLDNTLEFEVWTQGGSGVWHFDYDIRFSYATEDNQAHWLREGQADRIGLTFSGMQTLKGGQVPLDAQAIGIRAAETSPEASEEYEKKGGPATVITGVKQDKSSVAIYSLEQIRASASKKTLRVSFGDFAGNKQSLQAAYKAKRGIFGILESLENDPENAPEHQKRVYAFTIHARVALTKKGETPNFTNPSAVATIYVYNPAIN